MIALLTSTLLHSAAAMAAVTALGKYVYDLQHRELDLGLLGLAEFAPAALLVLVTGTVADRYDRRLVAAAAQAFEVLAAIGLAMVAASDNTSVTPVFALVLVFGVGRAFAAPAARSLPADIVDAERLPWLIARFSGTWQLALIGGPVLGGALYVIGPAWPFVAMGVLQLSAAVAILQVDPRHTAKAPRLDGEVTPRGLHVAMEGLRFIRGHEVLLGAIALDLFAVLFGGALALLPAIAEDRLHVDAVGLGWLRAAGGAGAAVVTLLLTRRPVTRRVGRTLLFVVALFGGFTVVLGLTSSFWVALASMAVLSGADAVSVFIRATLVPLVTPKAKRGRVMAVENVFIGASNELGAFESGVTGSLLGAGPAIVLGGLATLGVAAVWWVRFPALRDVDRFPESAEPTGRAAGAATEAPVIVAPSEAMLDAERDRTGGI